MDSDTLSHFGKNFVGLDALPEGLRDTVKGALSRVNALESEGELSRPGGNGDHEELPFLPEYKSWQVGGVEYELRAPIIKQEKQFLTFLRERQKAFGPVKLDGGDIKGSVKKAATATLSLDNLVSALGEGIAELFAIILTPKGMAVKDKNLAEIAAHLEDNLTLPQQAEALQGFFGYAQYAGRLLAPQIENMMASAVKALKKGLSR
jgi:hypothetical protein